MPNDKWGIPFFYPTKETAGVSGKGTGFFWQQNNDIFQDSKNGMVRIGKEFDDVRVISKTTGEWEFPYDSGADYYCLETETGHHSGGESHGCEGAEYNANVTINETPPKFYFQKQMYHGGNKYEDPKTKRFTHQKADQKIVGGGWFGFAVVRYNKKDGRSSDHDSVVLEIWWNNNPDADLKDWTMIKRTEDKGGWGKGGGSCNGVDDQVINWSNIQFRYKSGTPEFSIHPRIPEFEDGENIHSIDEEDMDFTASEKRGYGKRADMPRDIEMKALFKFASNNGICRLKHLSLREIDASKAFDDTPEQPASEQPGETHTIQGKFKLQWDLNTKRISACQGTGTGTEPVAETEESTGGGGGTTGNTRFYTITETDNDKELSNNSVFDNRTRVAEKCGSSSSRMKGKKLVQLDVKIKKEGSPGSSPSIHAKIWNSSGSVIYDSPTTIDPSTLSTSFTKKSFDFSGNTHSLVVGDRVGIEYTGTSDTDYVQVPWVSDALDGEASYVSQWESGGWDDKNSRDFSCEMWE